MIKAILSNDETQHVGNFGINVVIDKPVSDLSINDFLFEAVSGNGITNVEFPSDLEVVHLPETSLMIPVDLPDNVSGRFQVSMRDREYTVDNTQYDIDDNAVDLPEREQHRLQCEPKVFSYRTRG
ncbi:hypothetical protein F4X90_21815 [Candidatus Poribacteria bacterium]|nr:hypothetical protein [Candidatus Poribacteria bacterium]